MKTKTIILATIITWVFTLTTGFGQDYFPFPDSNAFWRVDWMTNSCFFSNIPEAEYQYVITGDTTIGNYSYNKVERSGLSGLYCPPPIFYGYGYAGAIRNDIANKKVYIVLADSVNEIVFYDFNLSVGDTLNGYFALDFVNYICQNPIVISIDSIQIGTSSRKRSEVAGMMCESYIIEGIGSDRGLIEPMSTMEEGGYLVCFKQNGQTLYPDTSNLCSLVTDIPEYHLIEYEFGVFPNPANSILNVILPEDFNFSCTHLEIVNVTGQKVSEHKIISKHTEIKTKQLPEGIYILKIFRKEIVMASEKFIIYR